MQKKKLAGTYRQCAAAALLAAVAACTEDMPAEAPAVAELPQPEREQADTAVPAVAANAPLKTPGTPDALQEHSPAGTVAAALHNIRHATEPAVPVISEETEFGRYVLAYLDHAAARRETETEFTDSPEDGLAAADSVGAGTLEPSGLTGAAETTQTVSAAAQPPAAAPLDPNALSDEQDFAAVASRETIESDAERRRLQVASRRVFEPADLPQGQGKANVALFALSTNHSVGSQVYDRYGSFFARLLTDDKCAEFSDDFEAQQTFLDAGGPLDDELRIDPDGDGFACGWTPYIYRSMLN